MKTSLTPVIAALVALAPMASAYAQHTSQGSWIWVNRAGGHASHQNQSTLRVNADSRSGRYCYDNKCWNVAIVARGNAYTFSTNGNNFFEFESGSPDDMIGRYWSNSGNTAGAPEAVFRGK